MDIFCGIVEGSEHRTILHARLLLQFVENLEKHLYNASEGCAVAMATPPKVNSGKILCLSIQSSVKSLCRSVYVCVYVSVCRSLCVYVSVCLMCAWVHGSTVWHHLAHNLRDFWH